MLAPRLKHCLQSCSSNFHSCGNTSLCWTPSSWLSCFVNRHVISATARSVQKKNYAGAPAREIFFFCFCRRRVARAQPFETKILNPERARPGDPFFCFCCSAGAGSPGHSPSKKKQKNVQMMLKRFQCQDKTHCSFKFTDITYIFLSNLWVNSLRNYQSFSLV